MNTANLLSVTTENPPIVLIVEDDSLLQETYADLLGNHIQLYAAFTIEDALSYFDLHQHTLVAIVVDACVPGNTPNTLPVVRHIRESGFAAPIMATSSNPDYREQLVAAGCSHSCEKKDVAKVLMQILLKEP
jgi:CheY-like chemotaxis protein